MKPVLIGCESTTLSKAEADLFKQLAPFGFILFARNVESPQQLSELTQSLRAATRPDAPIFIDQEGGRVARLRPPHWLNLPPMGAIGALYGRDKLAGLEAMQLHAEITAARLTACGINGNCAPVLDIHYEGASLVMGDRTFGSDLEAIVALGRMAVETYLQNGVYPVIKHMPGHGRVMVDPHETLPFVDAPLEALEEAEFIPFQALKDAPIAMNCHVVFRALDPEHPVSLSPKVHQDIIRGKIGFNGLLFTDDLNMGAIGIPLADRGPQSLQAGADIALFCTGKPDETSIFCQNIPEITPTALSRWQRAQNRLSSKTAQPEESRLKRLETLLLA